MTCNRVKTEVIQVAQIHAIRSSFDVLLRSNLSSEPYFLCIHVVSSKYFYAAPSNTGSL